MAKTDARVQDNLAQLEFAVLGMVDEHALNDDAFDPQILADDLGEVRRIYGVAL